MVRSERRPSQELQISEDYQPLLSTRSKDTWNGTPFSRQRYERRFCYFPPVRGLNARYGND